MVSGFYHSMNKYEGKLTKSYDTAIFAYTVLKRLGCGKIDTFEQRLKSQKVQYFAQLFRVSPSYSFSLYLRGPYSSDLAHDLFTIRDENNIDVDVSMFIPDELEERFIQLKKFIGEMGTRELEIASTLHLLVVIAKMNQVKARVKLKEWKGATENEIKEAFNKIENL